MNNTNIFRTRELSLAAYLSSHGIKYLGPERISKNSYYFTFENPDKCVDLEKSFIYLKEKLLKGFDYASKS